MGHPLVNLDDPFLSKLQNQMQVGGFVFVVKYLHQSRKETPDDCSRDSKFSRKRSKFSPGVPENTGNCTCGSRNVCARGLDVCCNCSTTVVRLLFVHLRSVETLDGFYVIAVQHL